MSSGWVCLHRKFIEWEWYTDPNVVRLFLHCLIKANHQDNKWRGNVITRGSFITSYDHLSKELKLSVKQIRTALTKLKGTSEVASKSNSQHTVLTVVNYELYQGGASERASQGQAKGKRGATTNNDNNDNKKKNSRFTPPTQKDVEGYIAEKGYSVNAVKFISFYESKGWKVGSAKMACWKSAVTGWQTRDSNNSKKTTADMYQGGV